MQEHEYYNLMARGGPSQAEMDLITKSLESINRILKRQAKRIDNLQKKVVKLERRKR